MKTRLTKKEMFNVWLSTTIADSVNKEQLLRQYTSMPVKEIRALIESQLRQKLGEVSDENIRRD